LQDPFGEFFIEQSSGNEKEIMSEDFWNMFQIRVSMLPSFITPRVAEKVLFIGKAVKILNQQTKSRITTTKFPAASNSNHHSPFSAADLQHFHVRATNPFSSISPMLHFIPHKRLPQHLFN
jgi:hypothetical protein